MRVHLLAVRCAMSWLALLAPIQAACVGGHIPPSTFHFTNIVPYTGPRSGWKVAQVLVLLAKISPIFPETATCEIEVGVPEYTVVGPISDEFAQAMAARAADEAARIVLREWQPTALICMQFRERMQSILNDPPFELIPGARVSVFQTAGVLRKTFP